MEKDQKVASEDPKIDLFEDDDEFEEFNINEGVYGISVFGCENWQQPEWDEKEEGKDSAQQWEDDWDDDDVNDDFSLQLKKELENNAEKS
ncbi:hypothetical protein GBA52_028804 [Prunus armeniaca]|nr:hypothetical protein GBA52_028804 [Prunus armeniaca]